MYVRDVVICHQNSLSLLGSVARYLPPQRRRITATTRAGGPGGIQRHKCIGPKGNFRLAILSPKSRFAPDALARRTTEEMGHAVGRREENVHPASRRLRRVSDVHRPRDRPHCPGGAGPGQTRQHAHHLHQRRQRRERGRHGERHDVGGFGDERRQYAGRRTVEVVRRLGHRPDLSALRGWMGLGIRHAL